MIRNGYELLGMWRTWLKEHCVAIGWSPDQYHLIGPAQTANWEKIRSRARQIKPGDIVIPYLENYQFGIPGKVVEVAIGDEQWNPTVPKGQYAKVPDRAWLGEESKLNGSREIFLRLKNIRRPAENEKKNRGSPANH